MKKNISLRNRILAAMTALVLGILLVAGTIFSFTTKRASDAMAVSNKNLNETIEASSSTYMSALSQSRMLELARGKAEIADQLFSEFRQSVITAATIAEQIYNNPNQYPNRTVPLPDASKDGEMSIQVLYSAYTDPDNPAIQKELGLLGNVQDTLMAINASHSNIASIYVATTTGFMVQADYISGKKYDEKGNLLPLEAKQRPWYIGASMTGKPFFTAVTKDAHTPRLAIMCGVPVYAGKKLKGVAGAGMYLDDMEDLVRSVDLGDSGHACILNRSGQVLFSTYEDGTVAAVANAKDLRLSKDEDISELAKKSGQRRNGIDARLSRRSRELRSLRPHEDSRLVNDRFPHAGRSRKADQTAAGEHRFDDRRVSAKHIDLYPERKISAAYAAWHVSRDRPGSLRGAFQPNRQTDPAAYKKGRSHEGR